MTLLACRSWLLRHGCRATLPLLIALTWPAATALLAYIDHAGQKSRQVPSALFIVPHQRRAARMSYCTAQHIRPAVLFGTLPSTESEHSAACSRPMRHRGEDSEYVQPPI